jgi:hypothetical protein
MEYKTITVNVTTGETTESIVLMTAEEITKAQQEQAYVDAHAYIAKRASEYPPITDFADAYYWAQKGNTALMDAYVAKCEATKQKYPKGVA